MPNLEITLLDAEWQQVLDESRQDASTRWQVLGDDDYVLAEGRITHIPFIDKRQWMPTARIFVGRGDIGEPVCVGYIRSIRKIRKASDADSGGTEQGRATFIRSLGE